MKTDWKKEVSKNRRRRNLGADRLEAMGDLVSGSLALA
jgi:hypothetical protein